MRLRLHHPLLAGFVAIVALMVLLLASLVGTRLRTQLVAIFEGQLTRELALGRALLDRAAGEDPDEIAGVMGSRTGYRVTLINADGRVIGDSGVPRTELGEVENHAGRPEVRESIETGEVAFARRLSATVGVELLYGAVPARLDGDPVVLRIAAPLDYVDQTVSRSQRALLGAGAGALVLAGVVAYLLSRAFTRPMRTLADKAGLLAAGDLSSRAPRSFRVAELDDLSAAFNSLADELQARLAELGRERDEMQALIDCMAEGVIALTDDARILRTNRAARELLQVPDPIPFSPVGTLVRQPELRDLLEESVVQPVQAREVSLRDRHLIVSSRMLDQGGAVTTFLDISEIRRLEQVRRDFVANASHELKTPLTAIRGFAETLLEDEPPPHLRARFLTAVRNNTVRLQRLVDDLLDLSRLESGGWRAERARVEVARVAEDAWFPLREEAERRRIELEIEGDAGALADRAGLEQIFSNLLDNAVRYSPDGGSVSVTIEPRRRFVEIAVTDQGAGIPAKALPRIFERFYRVDAARDREMGGTGLGLAIVRHLVSSMGGKVTAESELGHGTTIRFTLPLDPR
jgi:two-component system phosphate regulon sensor histidine kinase PhoR